MNAVEYHPGMSDHAVDAMNRERELEWASLKTLLAFNPSMFDPDTAAELVQAGVATQADIASWIPDMQATLTGPYVPTGRTVSETSGEVLLAPIRIKEEIYIGPYLAVFIPKNGPGKQHQVLFGDELQWASDGGGDLRAAEMDVRLMAHRLNRAFHRGIDLGRKRERRK
jgi:hypothetical protein